MEKTKRQLPRLPCACSSLRRAVRVLTQRYEEELRPFGLSSSQFTILQALDITGEVRQGALGEILAMDSTSLTRTLRIMLRERWLSDRRGTDQRERLISLSDAGREMLTVVKPRWQKVQENLRKELGETRWAALFDVSDSVAQMENAKEDEL